VFVEQYGPASTMAEPLLYRDRLIGVLVVTHGEPGRFFLMPDREPLAVLAAQATIAIENARLFQESIQRQAWLTNILKLTTHCYQRRYGQSVGQTDGRGAPLMARYCILRTVGWSPLGNASIVARMRQKCAWGGRDRASAGESGVYGPDVQAHPDANYARQRAAGD
jgi:hypothetical protein